MQFTIALAAPSYAAGTPIPIDMALVNVSSRPERVNTRLAVNDEREPAAFREVTFDVRTPSGKRAAFRLDIKIGAPHADRLVVLEPRRSARRSIDLAKYYAIREPGSYEVRATYASAAPGTVAGPVASNTVRFTLR